MENKKRKILLKNDILSKINNNDLTLEQLKSINQLI